MLPSLLRSASFRVAALLALVCAACTVHSASTPTRSESASAAPTPEPPDLAYSITRASDSEVRIDVTFRGSDGGVTELSTNSGWGGVQSSGVDLAHVEAWGASDRVLDVEHREAHRWFVRHTPSEPVRVAYVLPANANQASTEHSNHYRPMVGPALFHAIGEHALLAPVHLVDASERRIRLEWRGFRSAVCSFGTGEQPLELFTSVESFRHAVFLAGDVRVLARDVRGSPLFVAITGAQWSFSDDAFADLAARIVEAQRAFFDDFDHPYYLISLMPVGLADPHSTSLGGTALTQSFALFLQPDTRIESSGGHGLDVAGLLAHEMFHHWNGRIVTLAQPEQRMYWLSEGFTNFFARRLLLRLGSIDTAAYATSLNAALAAYALSPVRDASNERVVESFWTDRAIGELPYQRGDLVAVWLDGEIRAASASTRSLDDFLRMLVREAQDGAPPMTSERFLAHVRDWIGDAGAARCARFVEGVEPIELDPDRYEPCLSLTTVPMGAFDLGFDLERSRAEKKICGVRAGSAAQDAGLVDGQALVGLSVHIGRSDMPVELQIGERDTPRTIRYLPRGEVRPVTQFVVRAGAHDCSML